MALMVSMCACVRPSLTMLSRAALLNNPISLEVCCGAGPAEERKRLRLELLRWHPDKFTGAFGSRLAAGDKARILERVTQISQYLNSLA